MRCAEGFAWPGTLPGVCVPPSRHYKQKCSPLHSQPLSQRAWTAARGKTRSKINPTFNTVVGSYNCNRNLP